jgi:hypothetical protein
MNVRRVRFVLVVLAGILVMAAPSAMLAQINTVNLSGTVTDPQGLAVSGAKVTVTSSATGAERTATTNSSGRYELIGLPPGNYSVTIDAGGFDELVGPRALAPCRVRIRRGAGLAAPAPCRFYRMCLPFVPT